MTRCNNLNYYKYQQKGRVMDQLAGSEHRLERIREIERIARQHRTERGCSDISRRRPCLRNHLCDWNEQTNSCVNLDQEGQQPTPTRSTPNPVPAQQTPSSQVEPSLNRYTGYTLGELRNRLRQLHLPTTGRRQVLIDRIRSDELAEPESGSGSGSEPESVSGSEPEPESGTVSESGSGSEPESGTKPESGTVSESGSGSEPESDDDDVCGICLSGTNDEDGMLINGCDNCEHKFHQSCIDRWISTSAGDIVAQIIRTSCPICRRQCRNVAQWFQQQFELTRPQAAIALEIWRRVEQWRQMFRGGVFDESSLLPMVRNRNLLFSYILDDELAIDLVLSVTFIGSPLIRQAREWRDYLDSLDPSDLPNYNESIRITDAFLHRFDHEQV